MADVSVKMGVSGISQFKQGMNEAQASVKTLDAALKANEKQFAKSGDAEAHYAAQTTLLNQKLKQQKQIIENAEKALKQMEDNGVKQSSTAYQNMQRKLIEATSAMMDTQDQLDNLGSKAAGTAEKTDQLASSLGGLNKKVSLEQVIGAVNSITDGLEKAAKKAVDLGKELWNQIMDSARRADDTATMAEMYGIDLDTFQRMQKLVAGGMDTSVEAILTAQDKLKKGIGSGNKQVMEYMQELGLMYETGKGSMTFITDDTVEMFWQAGKAIMAMGDAYDKEAAAQAMFGKSWKELIPLFNTYDSLEAYNEALAEQTVNSEDTIRDLAALNDAVSALESNWTTLKNEVLGALAPALTKGAEAISGLLDSLTEYLKTEDGQQMLESMGKAVEGLFKDISEIDPQEVVEGFTGVFNSIIEGFKWLEQNSGTVVTALESIVIGWGALKLTGGVLDIIKLIDGIKELGTAGTAGASSAGAAAGTAWATSFANALVSVAPMVASMLGITAVAVAPAAYTMEQVREEWRNRYAEREAVAELGGENAWFISQANDVFGTEGQTKRAAEEALLMGLASRQNQQKAELYNLLSDRFTSEAGFTWNALNDFWNGKEMDQVQIEAMLQDITNAFAESDQNASVPVEPELMEGSEGVLQSELDMMHLSASVILNPVMAEGEADGEHANGIWSVPFDGYAAVLHKGEKVVPAREVERASRNYSSNLYVESMYMNNGTDAEGLAAAIAAANRRTMHGYGS